MMDTSFNIAASADKVSRDKILKLQVRWVFCEFSQMPSISANPMSLFLNYQRPLFALPQFDNSPHGCQDEVSNQKKQNERGALQNARLAHEHYRYCFFASIFIR